MHTGAIPSGNAQKSSATIPFSKILHLGAFLRFFNKTLRRNHFSSPVLTTPASFFFARNFFYRNRHSITKEPSNSPVQNVVMHSSTMFIKTVIAIMASFGFVTATPVPQEILSTGIVRAPTSTSTPTTTADLRPRATSSVTVHDITIYSDANFKGAV
ncbi:hypothetical protein EG327_001568 [Venturia inaequalis]|uniref:Uncharacterized protein n=1 Tax=Venturia inaequalis TaxID=5025 RepID=A0A8H3VP40_VENIN|nr:hypothetical protein EG327_001568 [Venturia inaequalis]